MHTIQHHAVGIQKVLAMIPKLGLEVPQELLEGSYLKAEITNDAFSLHKEFIFFEKLIDLMKDPLIGLKIGEAYLLEAYEVFGLTILTAPTLRSALYFSENYGALTYTLLNLKFVEDDRLAHLQLIPSNLKLSSKLRSFFADRDTSASVVGLNQIWRGKLPYQHINLVHGGHGQKDVYRDYFDCEVTFNAPLNSLSFDKDLLDEPLPLSAPDVHSLCLNECKIQYSKLAQEDDVLARVRQEFTIRPGYLHDFPSIAAQLGMSERTLRRRLRELGTSYQKIQQEIRFQLAKDYLQNSALLLKEIAEVLGYRDASTFTNAFKGWNNGISPKKYRLGARYT